MSASPSGQPAAAPPRRPLFAVADPPPERWRPVVPRWAWALLIGATCAVYSNSLWNGFHYDDFGVIVANPAVRQVADIPSHFVSGTVGNPEAIPSYRPLLMATFVLNYAWGGTSPTGYHVVNLVLHASAACLVVLLVWHLTAHAWAAWWAGLLFALHPIQTEAVNYISARSSILYATASLGAIILFIRFRRTGRPGTLAGAGSAYLAALFSKEAAVIVPVLLLGYDVLVGRRTGRDLARWIPAHGVFVLVTFAFLAVRRLAGGAVTLAGPLDAWPVILTYASIVERTLRDQIAPVGLSLGHAFGPVHSLDARAVVAALVLVGLCAATVGLRRRAPLLAYAAFWFPVALLPVSVLTLITRVALYQENRGYLSAVGMVMVVGPALAVWWDGCSARTKRLRQGLLVGAIVMLAIAVLQRNTVWRDEITLWTDVLEKAPANQAAYVNLGAAYQSRGELESAADVYRGGIERFPDNGILHNNLGAIYRSQGDVAAAAREFQAAIRAAPRFAMPYYNLGLILYRGGARTEAAMAFQRFLDLAPGQDGTAPHVPKARGYLIDLRGTGASGSDRPPAASGAN